jgi:D-threo-aldose 1-dehydrogenase
VADDAPSQPQRLTLLGTSLSTTRLGVGTHALHRILSTKARQRLLGCAFERGVRHFDTAPSYGAGLAELELGRFAAGRRSELVLTTKFGIRTGRLAAAVPGWLYAQMLLRLAARVAGFNSGARTAPRRNYSPALVRGTVEDSLRRLRTDHIDVLFLHEPQLELLDAGDFLERALEDLQVSGKIRYIGLSGNGIECARIVAQRPGLATVLQTEVQAGAPPPAGAGRAAVQVCEFGPPVPGGLDPGFLRMLRKLRDASRESVLLLSTSSIDGLREAVDSI